MTRGISNTTGIGGRPPRPPVERFWDQTSPEPNTGCWIWTGAVNPRGYGVLYVNATSRTQGAHRFSWVLHNGAIPEGLFVCHHCDNPPCVNPAHLFLGTHNENMRDRNLKNRQARGVRTRPRRIGVHTKPERFPRGEQHPRAKLTDAAVREMRARYGSGEVSGRQLAKLFGVEKRAAMKAIAGETWRHVK